MQLIESNQRGETKNMTKPAASDDRTGTRDGDDDGVQIYYSSRIESEFGDLFKLFYLLFCFIVEVYYAFVQLTTISLQERGHRAADMSSARSSWWCRATVVYLQRCLSLFKGCVRAVCG